MTCPFYRGDIAPRCTAVAGCLPAREVDRKRLCLTDRFDRCDLHALRYILDAPVDAALATALRDKDLDRRRTRLADTAATWLKSAERAVLAAAPAAERVPAQSLLAGAVSALTRGPVPPLARVVHTPALCGIFERLARALRVVAHRVPDQGVDLAASVLEVGAGLLPSDRESLSW